MSVNSTEKLLSKLQNIIAYLISSGIKINVPCYYTQKKFSHFFCLSQKLAYVHKILGY